ncbi:fatty acid synthase-like [Pogonomyrmex barbatus]|uniref:Fatty acid synthase-like n=1 Tax=Pogonomyrmex barbatus TaxID=144034 RepID=A0A8N1S903_9HYME|nr:fatty acid synthase-like [Pogonomyrmex barbatus]
MGTINNLGKFDADFFGFSVEQAHACDPMLRMLLEHSYEAVIDAGINPKQLRGKNTAVIVGLAYNEAYVKFLYEDYQIGGINIIGCSRATIANMISYFLNLKGPSYTMDSACSSAIHAIALGYHCIMSVPDAWTFEEAATVPCVYSTVYYALYILGKMKKGDKILIHSGTGGIGQAAIHLALHEGCEIFTTVGTHEKRDFIKELFPTILDEHIGNSRDVSFEQMIMRQTHGRGVDIVLNSLAEEKLIASVRCLAQNGRFLEIGKFDMVSNNCLSMSLFQKGISFYGVLLDNMFTSKHKSKSLLSNMIADGLEDGAIKPIRATIFSKSDIEAAFRYMASGQHMGKIIINIQEKDKSSCESVVAYRRYYCVKDKSYIIIGGLGGFGLELTDWLILRGARNIVLISRTGIKNGYQRVKVRLWESYGVNVQIVKNIDVSDPKIANIF